ncbi:MAG: hypothetical protein JJU05_07380 [Verrucomicrobia bacterium]|nr:hypothetical protein [Verrucomicrobiota bacterium]MCH8526119.1 hypothetical protein [Kiritimatiellia bacterium]
MSEGEFFLTIIFLVLFFWSWGKIYRLLIDLSPLLTGARKRLATALLLPAYLAGLFYFLRVHADEFVRDDTFYLAFYLLFGAAWTGWSIPLLSFFGLSLRDEVLERRGGAATGPVFAAILGSGLCYAGANIGDGPGWWVVLICAAMSLGAFLLLWILLAALCPVRRRVLVDRDRAASRRLTAFLLASGLILGRASAGDWTSMEATWGEFADAAWPVLPLWAAALLIEHILEAAREDADPNGAVGTGTPVAMLYLGFAYTVLKGLGPW